MLSFIMTFFMVASLMLNVTTVIQAEEEPVSAVFGGGPFVFGGQSVVDDIKASGFNTVMIWAVHVREDGDLYLNDVLACENGAFVGEQSWVDNWQSLKQGDTSVNRVEISVGAWGSSAFQHIKEHIDTYGTGSETVLYKNFQALINATGADAVNYDDESTYDVPSSVAFGQMCMSMGAKITLCPYTNTSYWQSVKNQLGAGVDRVYLQCYAGGAGNNPGTWQNILGMKVIPGLWCLHSGSGLSASAVQSQMTSWKNDYDIAGGFMWLYDDIQKLSSPNLTADYASAINVGCGSTQPPNTYPTIGGRSYYEWISNVEMGTLNHASGDNGGYGDFTSQVLNVTKGSAYNVSLMPGFRNNTYTEYWKVWIDYNQDGDFLDSGEEVFSGSGKSVVSGSITIATSASVGTTRMRVVMKYNGQPPSSGNIGDGEAEDYTLNIQ